MRYAEAYHWFEGDGLLCSTMSKKRVKHNELIYFYIPYIPSKMKPSNPNALPKASHDIIVFQ